jgi:hypothetical protein
MKGEGEGVSDRLLVLPQGKTVMPQGKNGNATGCDTSAMAMKIFSPLVDHII